MTLSLSSTRRSGGTARIAHRFGRGTLAIIAAHQRLAAICESEQHQPIPPLPLAAQPEVGDNPVSAAIAHAATTAGRFLHATSFCVDHGPGEAGAGARGERRGPSSPPALRARG